MGHWWLDVEYLEVNCAHIREEYTCRKPSCYPSFVKKMLYCNWRKYFPRTHTLVFVNFVKHKESYTAKILATTNKSCGTWRAEDGLGTWDTDCTRRPDFSRRTYVKGLIANWYLWCVRLLVECHRVGSDEIITVDGWSNRPEQTVGRFLGSG
jgi:hypothetical protein